MLYFSRWKTVSIIAVCVLGVLFALPNFFSQRQLDTIAGWGFLPTQQINLGLDLRGGSYLLIEVDVETLKKERLENLKDDIRATLRKERIGYRNLNIVDDTVGVRINQDEDVAKAEKLISDLVTPVGTILGGLQQEYTVATNQRSISVEMTEATLTKLSREAVTQSIEIIRRRIDELGTTEPIIQQQGDKRIIVQAPGVDDPEELKRIIGTTAKLSFHLLDNSVSIQEALNGRVPPGAMVLPGLEDDPGGPYLLKKRAVVGGEDLVTASGEFNQQNSEWVVSFRFNTSGAKKFGDITLQNVGRPFAIVLDEKVISAPVIREPILGGSGQISGNFTVESANELAILLSAGALPAPLEFVQESSVGALLGADSVAKGELAAVIGFAGVIVFIFISYGLFGVFANAALIINVVLIAAALSFLQATLTLPGIAGIVLTIGMAVDANVLIFERIREEFAAGKTPINAIDAGYSRALSTILDANITTLIAAVLLFSFGSGPIRGFSVTLGIGIVTSVFTAFVVTRLMIATWVRARRPSLLPI